MTLNKQHLTQPSALEDVTEFCHYAVCKMCTYLVLLERYARYCTLVAKLSLLIEHLTIRQKEQCQYKFTHLKPWYPIEVTDQFHTPATSPMGKFALVESEAGWSPELFWTLQAKEKYVVQPENEPGILGLPTHVLFIIPVQLFSAQYCISSNMKSKYEQEMEASACNTSTRMADNHTASLYNILKHKTCKQLIHNRSSA